MPLGKLGGLCRKLKLLLKQDDVEFTEIIPATKFYKAEDYHQQYFKKNPHLRDHCGV